MIWKTLFFFNCSESPQVSDDEEVSFAPSVSTTSVSKRPASNSPLKRGLKLRKKNQVLKENKAISLGLRRSSRRCVKDFKLRIAPMPHKVNVVDDDGNDATDDGTEESTDQELEEEEDADPNQLVEEEQEQPLTSTRDTLKLVCNGFVGRLVPSKICRGKKKGNCVWYAGQWLCFSKFADRCGKGDLRQPGRVIKVLTSQGEITLKTYLATLK
jgi:uncharacterized protein YnzC (UPF0291/DUF896 family)